MNPQEIAETVRDAMWDEDRASQAMGMQVVEVGPGRATLEMRVRDDMLNAHDLCHGGIVATLADSAFGYACNSFNEVSVASGFDVNLTTPARRGDRLTAVARLLSLSGRTGVYDVVVTNQHGDSVAAFRGRSYTVKGKPVVEGLPMGRTGAALQSGD